MDVLVIARHGDEGDPGREQMQNLARSVGLDVEGKSVLLLSSTASWAVESSAVLAAALGCEYQVREELNQFSEVDRYVHDIDVVELAEAERDKAQVLILVTHKLGAFSAPALYCKRNHLGDIGLPVIRRGSAVVIDCNAKISRLVESEGTLEA